MTESQAALAWRRAGSQRSPSATGTTPTSRPMSAYPKKLETDGSGVAIAAGISFTVWIPVELVTPTVIGSSSTQLKGTTIVLERRRPRVVGPSTVYGTIASSTLTFAIVNSSGCGFRTRIRISPGVNVTRRMSNSSAGGGLRPTMSASHEPPVETAPTMIARSSTGTIAHRRQPRRLPAGAVPASTSPRPRRSPSSRARRTPTGGRGT